MILSKLCIGLVLFYRWILSPAKRLVFGPFSQCRFEPSCSAYALKAFQTHKAVDAISLSAKRVCRCHPWGESGFDPVPFKSR